MVDVDFTSIRCSSAVVRRQPVGFYDRATERVNLGKPERVTLQHLLARITAITVDVEPVLEEGSAVAARVLTFDSNRLQYVEGVERCTGVLYREIRLLRLDCSDDSRADNDRRDRRNRHSPLHEATVAPPMKVRRSSSSCMSMKMHSPGQTSAAITTDD